MGHELSGFLFVDSSYHEWGALGITSSFLTLLSTHFKPSGRVHDQTEVDGAMGGLRVPQVEVEETSFK